MNKTNTNTEFDPVLFAQFQMFLAMQEQMNKDKEVTKFKRKRREKGSGSVTRLTGGRARPFMASVTGERDPLYGTQKNIPLAYFEQKKQAEKFLDLYVMERDGLCEPNTAYNYVLSVKGTFAKSNSSQTSLHQNNRAYSTNQGVKTMLHIVNTSKCPTVADIWEKLFSSDLAHLSDSTKRNYVVAYNHLQHLHNMRIDKVRLKDIQPLFDKAMEEGTGHSKMNVMKIVLNYIFKYAIKYDYTEKNYAAMVVFRETLDEKDKRSKKPFSKDTIKILFENDHDIIVQSILVMIYTGMSPSELLQLERKNIHLEDRYMIGGIKTSNGINRVIPIHECIVPYIENLMSSKVIGLSYSRYFALFSEIKNNLKFECTPHSGRHTFATLCNEYELNDFLVKKIIGHSAKDLTKDVYTHVDTQRLIVEVNKLPILR